MQVELMLHAFGLWDFFFILHQQKNTVMVTKQNEFKRKSKQLLSRWHIIKHAVKRHQCFR